MSGRLRSEGGSALITAIIVVSLLLMIGFATMSWAETGFRTSRQEREGESSFNLAEAVLKAQVYELSRNWPSSTSTVYHCPDTAQPLRCPSGQTLTQSFTGNDYAGAGSLTWSTDVQDNGGSVRSRYTTALAAGQPGYDANGDGRLWVRAEATVRGRQRRLLTQVQARRVPLPFPQNAITAQFIKTTNQGAKTIIDTQGTSAQAGDIAVRCTPPVGTPDTTCLAYQSGQVSPPTAVTGYSTSDALTAQDIDTLRALAKQDNTYYDRTCPSNLTGAIVFIEDGSFCPTYQSGTANSASSPGVLVINKGPLSMSGNFEYYGLVYAHNAGSPPISGTVISLQGTSLIHGAVAVDGPGGIFTGSSGLNIIYDKNVFGGVKGYGAAEPLPGLWRDLGPN